MKKFIYRVKVELEHIGSSVALYRQIKNQVSTIKQYDKL